MKAAERTQRDYILLSADGSYLSLSPSLKKSLSGNVDFYISRDGRSAALVESPDGQLEVVVLATASPGYQRHVICSRVLGAYLKGRSLPGDRRIPAGYDATARALLLGEAASVVDAEFSTDNFTKVSLRGIRKFDCQILDGCIRVNKGFRFRSEAYSRGDCLAFVKYNDGSVVLENDGEMCLVRKPEVLAFAKSHWRGKLLYARILGDAVIVSPDLIALSYIENTKGFLPLEPDQMMTADLGRDFSVSISPEAHSMLGTKLAVYACGPHLALCSHRDGDLEISRDGRIHSMLLSHQIAVDFPMALRLYLIPHGNLLLLSADQALDTRALPPPNLFCRLLIAQDHAAPPMRYGAYRPVAKAT